ncbi:MAG TPA: protein-L-isoaspartate(D-aspartate) O-methyltransferase [Opitutaceae bacterium]|nr:protein-L-isoaspartate(D-aspartate) O-methyltransferase [Opitutaceae bacterium]
MNSGEVSPAIDQALRRVPRGAFVGPQWQERAHEDRPLPIGCGQTTSQPSLVAYMTEQLALTPKSRVLEIGTGSGFQTAILAELAAEVFTVELLPELAASARQRLDGMGYRNVSYRVGDGAEGWPEHAPFDAIIVTAAGRALPPALIAQLRPGGRLLAPLGPPEGEQTLVLVDTRSNGEWHRRDLCSVWFVPLVSASLGDLRPRLGEVN